MALRYTSIHIISFRYSNVFRVVQQMVSKCLLSRRDHMFDRNLIWYYQGIQVNSGSKNPQCVCDHLVSILIYTELLDIHVWYSFEQRVYRSTLVLNIDVTHPSNCITQKSRYTMKGHTMWYSLSGSNHLAKWSNIPKILSLSIRRHLMDLMLTRCIWLP